MAGIIWHLLETAEKCNNAQLMITQRLGKMMVKVKVAHTWLPSIGFQSRLRFLAVNLQVMWAINAVVSCHYFLPGLQLPSQPKRGLYQFCWLVNRSTTSVNSLPKTVPDSIAVASSTLTTQLPKKSCKVYQNYGNLRHNGPDLQKSTLDHHRWCALQLWPHSPLSTFFNIKHETAKQLIIFMFSNDGTSLPHQMCFS